MSAYPRGSTLHQRETIDRFADDMRAAHGRLILAPHRDRFGRVTLQTRVGFDVLTWRIDMDGRFRFTLDAS